MLKALANGDPVHTTTDGSKLDAGDASAGWFFWLLYMGNDDQSVVADDPVDVRVCLFAGTILVDGRLESNTSFRAEAMGKLTVSILLHCLYEFIDRHPTVPTYHTCDNQALVKRVNGIRDEDNIHTLNDPIDGDIIVPTAYWATKTKIS